VSVFESVPTDRERPGQTYLERITDEVQDQLKDWKPEKEAQVQSKVLEG
jgi:hypothetical protein